MVGSATGGLAARDHRARTASHPRFAALVAACVVPLLFACATDTAEDTRPASDSAHPDWSQRLTGVRASRDGAQTVITLDGLEEPAFTVLDGEDPSLIVLELPGVAQPSDSLYEALFSSDREWPVDDDRIERVVTRSAQQSPGDLTRVEIRLAEPASHVVESTPRGLIVRLTAEPPAVAAAPAEPPAASVAPASADGATEIASAGAGEVATAGSVAADPSTAPVVALAVEEEVLTAAPAPPAVVLPASALSAIHVATTPSGIVVHLEANGTIDLAESFTVPDPDRLVVDLPGIERADVASTVAIGSDVVERVRLGVHPGKLRVVLDGGPRVHGFEGRRLLPVSSGLVIAVGDGADLDALLVATLSDLGEDATPPVAAGPP